MANTYVIGGKGTGADASDTNGGAFVTGSATATYANFQGTNGGPCAYQTGDPSTVTDSGQQYGLGFNCIRVTSAVPGDFTNAVVDAWAYCDFGTVYVDGRYQVKAVNANYVDLALQYSANDSCSTCNVGGALDLLSTAAAIDASGDTIYLPQNAGPSQRTYSESLDSSLASATAPEVVKVQGVLNDGSEITAVRSTPTGGKFANATLTATQFPLISFASGKRLFVGHWNILKSLSISGDTDGNAVAIVDGSTNDYLQIIDCIVVNAGTGDCLEIDGYSLLYNSDFKCTASDNADWCALTRFGIRVQYCTFTNAGTTNADGLLSVGALSHVDSCIFYNMPDADADAVNASVGTSNYSLGITNCIFEGIDGTCIRTYNAASYWPLMVVNNVVVNSNNFIVSGYAATGDQGLYMRQNAFYNMAGTICTAADWIGAPDAAERQDITLSADPFESVANGDYSIDKLATQIINGNPFKGNLGCMPHDPNYPAEADTFFGTGTYGIGGEFTPAMRASDIANCEAGNIKSGVTIDDVTGTYEGGGGGGGGLLAHPGMNGGINA